MAEQYADIRKMLEEQEHLVLSPYAAFSDHTLGRDREEDACDIRPAYQRDRDRIIHSKAFRRMKHKTQVFFAPEGDHYRTRLTHTLEVSQIARTIAKALRLNESLTEAIALGHDLGHTPFGHSGEAVLSRLNSQGFGHALQSVRVVEVLEKNGQGLNLTREVRDGIYNHRTAGHPATLEGQAVRLSDKIAYLNHDIDDAIRAGLMVEEDIPEGYRYVLGYNVHDRLSALIHDVIRSSLDKPEVTMSPVFEKALMELRVWMFDNVYLGGEAKVEEGRAQNVVEMLYGYYMAHPEEMSREYVKLVENGDTLERAVTDFISCMTDNYAIETFKRLYIPKSWHVI